LSFPSSHGPTEWLSVTPLQPAEALAPILARELEQSLAFFDSFADTRDLIAILEAGKSDFLGENPALDLAILHAYRGHCEHALSILNGLTPTRLPPGAIERIRQRCA
jgi:hypothetical protein